jgi:hypothetical protein
MTVGAKADTFLNDANKKVGPILTTAAEKAEALWVEVKRRNDLVRFMLRFTRYRLPID